ncbi:MAG: NYN domain-containing protein [Candidatus Firestonebacteria bacterium]
MWIIVDGYNVTKSGRFAADHDFRELKSERDRLLMLVRRYTERTSHRATVVFDASRTEELYASRQELDGIEVMYSRGGQTADDLIRDLIEKSANRRNIMVVTSDKGIASSVKPLGVSVAGADELYRKMSESSVTEIPLSKADYYEREVKGYEEPSGKNIHNKKGNKAKKKKRRLNLW